MKQITLNIFLELFHFQSIVSPREKNYCENMCALHWSAVGWCLFLIPVPPIIHESCDVP